MPHLPANNIELYYEQHGTGPDLILIGGLTSDHNIWRSTIRALSPHFRILIFDNRGSGQSSTPDYPYTMSMMAEDVLQLMDALKIEKAHILGHSMGAGIAMQLALHATNRVNKLILVCPRAKISAIGKMIFAMREKLQALQVSDAVLAEYVMPFLFSEHFLENKMNVKGFAQWSSQNPFPQTAIGFKHQLHASSTRDISKELHHILAPTLIIAGAEDILTPVGYAENLAKSFKNSTFVALADCAHMPHVEKAAEFAEVVLGFLGG